MKEENHRFILCKFHRTKLSEKADETSGEKLYQYVDRVYKIIWSWATARGSEWKEGSNVRPMQCGDSIRTLAIELCTASQID